ncbi:MULTISPECIES: DUF4382 domain-containing protein [unclassified Arcicella]|uniref:DUF4382 domain-containing protein n=1 Tax=unclassified Arcicella TaxID=2644986 RepID=UPI00285E347E|nr:MULTISPECIES: DUF4382 domain-containing protein [unclassified Arcicella]MDR6560604.1 hypothetical protein [Arcicella sp. BE51]MDR6810488.1 hypothetical protein [Arcicella sp. BE140]MDR6821838.1 hypothetical protein [Arcicella sp. BE139]
MKTRKILVYALLALGIITLQWSCSKDDDNVTPAATEQDPNAPKGQVKVGITDAPIDNAEINGAFVTITEVRLDGKRYDGFQGPKTVNIAELNNGNFLTLVDGKFQTGTYSKLTFVFDYEKDQAGNAPGTYISKVDGTKTKLAISGNARNSLDVNSKPFTVSETGTTDLMVDFDLRKAIKTYEENAKKNYSFVTYGELQSSVRVVNKSATGTITGHANGYNSTMMGKVVAYVYKKGEFNPSTEAKGQGDSSIEFKNAVSSSVVDGNGNFKVSFLEQGNYEIHFASYKPSGDANSSLTLNALLNVSSALDLNTIAVQSNTNVSVSLSITGVIGL